MEHIEHTVMSYPGVLGVHDLMVHDYGPGHQFASLHIEFPAEADPLEAHDIIDNIERDFLKKDHLQVTIHYDPIGVSPNTLSVSSLFAVSKITGTLLVSRIFTIAAIPSNLYLTL